MKINKVEYILNELDESIRLCKPFNLIRLGDGGVKVFHSIIFKDKGQLDSIIEREGLPKNKMDDMLKLWTKFLNEADYIDTPDVYYNGKFWPRYKKGTAPISKRTDIRMRMWRRLYSEFGIKNTSYCNPEFNYLSCIKRENKINLFDILKDRKIMCITTRNEIINILNPICKRVGVKKIVGHNENQYEKSFKRVIDFIESRANNYDLWLVSAGELGRIYTGLIKNLGGRALDTGFVIDYWCTGYIHPRLRRFIKQNPDNKLEFLLTEAGNEYERFI